MVLDGLRPQKVDCGIGGLNRSGFLGAAGSGALGVGGTTALGTFFSLTLSPLLADAAVSALMLLEDEVDFNEALVFSFCLSEVARDSGNAKWPRFCRPPN